MSIFEYDEEKEIRLYRKAEREVGIEIGEQQGKEIGLSVLVKSLKGMNRSVEEIYHEVISREEYQTVTREKIEEYYI